MAAERPGLVVTRLVSRRALRSGLGWGLVFGLAVASSVEQFTAAYDTAESRRQIAGTIGGNGALRALFGSGRALETVPGWTAWRSVGIVTILGSIWALLAATRWLRGEEDSGRWELLVAGPTTRRRVTAQAVAGLGWGLVALWTAAAAVILVVGRVPEARLGMGDSLFLAVTLVAPAGVFLAAGAFASQLAPTRRQASRLAAAGFGVAFLLRVVGNSDPGWRWVQWLTPLGWVQWLTPLGWVQWLTPLGWVQHLQPLTDSSVLPLVPLVLLTGGLVVAAIALAGVRDVGAGVLSARDSAPPRTGLLGAPVGLAVHLERATWLSWAVGLAVMSFLFGVVASAVATTSSDALEDVFVRLGARDGGLEAYLGAFFLIIGAALGFAAAGQVAAIRDEEAQGHVDTLLVHPIGRVAWLSGLLAVSAAVLVGLGVIAYAEDDTSSKPQPGRPGVLRRLVAHLCAELDVAGGRPGPRCPGGRGPPPPGGGGGRLHQFPAGGRHPLQPGLRSPAVVAAAGRLPWPAKPLRLAGQAQTGQLPRSCPLFQRTIRWELAPNAT